MTAQNLKSIAEFHRVIKNYLKMKRLLKPKQMAVINANISIDLIWLKEPTDLSKCSACNDTIYSEKNVLYVMPSTNAVRLRGTKIDIVLCDACKDLYDGNSLKTN